MQQPQKAATEPKAQCRRTFWLKVEGAIVQPQLLQSVPQQPVLVTFDGIQPREHHRLDLFKPRQRLQGRVGIVHHCVADLRVTNGFNVGVEIPHFTSHQFLRRRRLRCLIPAAFHIVRLAVAPEAHLLAQFQAPIDYAQQNDDTAVWIEPGIEDERPQRQVDIATRRRHQMHNGFQRFRNPDALLGAYQNRVLCIEPDQRFNLFANPLRFRGRQIDLVQDRNNLQVVLQRQIRVR